MSDMHRRKFLLSTAFLAAAPLAGCFGPSAVAAGSFIDVDDLRMNVTHVDVETELLGDDEPIHARADTVLVLPWIRVENTGNDSVQLPTPISHIEVRLDGSRVSYVVGRLETVTIGDATHATYRYHYRERGGELASGETIEGYGPVYRMPANYDPSKISVVITYRSTDYEWRIEPQE